MRESSFMILTTVVVDIRFFLSTGDLARDPNQHAFMAHGSKSAHMSSFFMIALSVIAG